MKVVLLFLLPVYMQLQAVERFPHPEFESGYEVPATQVEKADPLLPPEVDAVLLALALVVGAYLTLKVRRRKMMSLLVLASLIYFGFIREGCICPVGSVQNVSNAFLNPAGTVGLATLLFFLLPLIAALVWGRVFCGGVCPLGVLQDIVVIKPLHLPRRIREGFGLFRYLWLGFAVLSAVTGAGYFICRFDPFVGFFRMHMSVGFFIFGAAVLALGTVIARPYCRFMCPYGVLLGWMSKFSFWHLTTTPDDCVECGLCPQSCPFDAIEHPAAVLPRQTREERLKKLGRTLLVAPVIVVIGLGAGYGLRGPVALLHPTLKLVRQLQAEDRTEAPLTEESKAFRMSGRPLTELYAEADAIRQRINTGSLLLGLFMALVICGKLVGTLIMPVHKEYRPDRQNCFSCGRCVEACPVEHKKRRGKTTAGMGVEAGKTAAGNQQSETGDI